MPRAEASIVVRAPPECVFRLYRDYRNWPRLFPATIRGVRLVREDGARVELEVDHREGKVPNVMTVVAADRVDLWEAKRRYEATFVNRFEPAREGTRYSVSADVRLKGAARLLGALVAGTVRRRIVRYVLEPMRVAAESAHRTGAAT